MSSTSSPVTRWPFWRGAAPSGYADFAILSAGGVTVPILPEQIAYQVEDADAKVLIVEDAAQLTRAVAAAETALPRIAT